MVWDVIGHQWAVDLLRKHIREKQVRHAYLFTGPEGIGKRTLSLRFAQALDCESPPSSGDTCGRCRACRLIPQEAYPDLHVVRPADFGGTLKVEEVRQLQHQLALSTFEGRWRVALLPRFHQATVSAANALLKTLEEPSPQVVLMLTSTSKEVLLPTIVSRCEVVPLRALAVGDLERALAERFGDEAKARLLARLSGGRPGKALQLASDETMMKSRQEWMEDLVTLLGQTRAERFQHVEKLTRERDEEGRRERLRLILDTWSSLWRDAMLEAYGAEATSANPDLPEEVARLVREFSAGTLDAALRATERTREAIQEFANPRLALENLMLDLPHWGKRE
jgi:DNA polymerase-3 subunit delta'